MVKHEDVVGQHPTWLDYAARAIPGLTLRRYGVGGVFRYLGASHMKSNWRQDLTKGEYLDLLAAGLEVIGVYETTTDEYKGGYSAGQQAARNILRDGGDWYTGKYCITVDQHFPPGDREKVRQYALGWISIIPTVQTVGYGFFEAIDVFREVGIDGQNWQCGNWSDVRPGVRWYQRNDSVEADAMLYINDVPSDVNDDLEGDDMALTPAQVKTLERMETLCDKVLGEFNPAEDNRPLEYGTKDDMRGALLTVEGYCKAISTGVDTLLEAAGTGGVAIDYDKLIAKLEEKGLVTTPALDRSLVAFGRNLVGSTVFGVKPSTNPGDGQ